MYCLPSWWCVEEKECSWMDALKLAGSPLKFNLVPLSLSYTNVLLKYCIVRNLTISYQNVQTCSILVRDDQIITHPPLVENSQCIIIKKFVFFLIKMHNFVNFVLYIACLLIQPPHATHTMSILSLLLDIGHLSGKYHAWSTIMEPA